MTIQESIKVLENEYVKRILGSFTNTTAIAEAILTLLEFAKKQILVDPALSTDENLNIAPVGPNGVLGFYQAREIVAVYGRLVGLDFVNPEENVMQVAYHPQAGILKFGEVVVCQRDYFDTLYEKAKADSKQ